jgi:hypothetical protein
MSSTPSPTNDAAGRGDSGQPSSGRRNNRRGFRGGTRSITITQSQQQHGSKFEGKEPTLKGFIYDLPEGRSSDQYVRTTKEIVNFVGRTYKEYTPELIEAVKKLKLEMPTEPADPETETGVAFEKWKTKHKRWDMKTEAFTNFKAGLYNTVIGQCTEALEESIRSHPDFPAAELCHS